MADRVTAEQRSRTMASVSSEGTAPELVVQEVLRGMGYHFLVNCKDMPGKPDIVLPEQCTVIFVHGCFWHGHAGCKRSSRPASNTAFWNKKLDANIARDLKHKTSLEEDGWQVVIVWECETEVAMLENSLREHLNPRQEQ